MDQLNCYKPQLLIFDYFYSKPLDLLPSFSCRNPNKPVKLDSFPDWMPVTTEDGKLMGIDYDSHMIDVPYKERMQKMRQVLLQSRKRHTLGARLSEQTTGKLKLSSIIILSEYGEAYTLCANVIYMVALHLVLMNF